MNRYDVDGNAHRSRYEDDNASHASGRSYHSSSSAPSRRSHLPAMPQHMQHQHQNEYRRYAASDVGGSSSASAWTGPSIRLPQHHHPQHQSQPQQSHHHYHQEHRTTYARSAVSDHRHGGGESNTDLVKNIFRAASAARRRRTGSFDAGHARQQQQQRGGVVDLNPERGGQAQRWQYQQQQQQQQQGQKPTEAEAEDQTAAQFARQSSMAGYLSKLGSTIPTYKRRFFVLKPQTLLYYFVSADDVEPRGCIELDDHVVVGRDVERLDDGRCRFEVWVGGDNDDGGDGDEGKANAVGDNGRRRVVLEAPNEETAHNWMEAISTQRLSHTKSVIAKCQEREGGLEDRIKSLEKELEAMRAIKAERDTALEDVQHWRRRHEELDEGVRLLTRVVRRPPVTAEKKADGDSSDSDDQSNKQREEEQQLLDLSIPDTSFASLRNVMGQLRSASHLAVKDAEAATERVSCLETSLSEAEDRIQHLERENVILRQDSQRRKRDNKILVKEVKNLRRSMEESRIEEDGRQKSAEKAGKLMAELEAHVATTLQLQQKLLSVSGSGDTEAKEMTESDAEDASAAAAKSARDDVDPGQDADEEADTANAPSPSKTPTKDNTHKSFTSSRKDNVARPPVFGDSPSPIAPTKLALVDNKDEAKATKGSLIDDEPSSSDEEDEDTEPNAIITETGQATSRLTCPLVDISSTNNTTGRASIESAASALSATGGEMYHLTFRSKKIGLQFQKVPTSSAKRGSLSSALADATDRSRAEDGELGQIAAIARRSEANDGAQQDVNAKVAMPIDVVLVCGFHGFDDNINPRRPDLGARLVAFDGISVELGSWTFDSIRRGIQARSRPLTLSFRNDPLSIQQREILTKAVAELNQSTTPAPRPLPPYQTKGRANHMRGAEDDTSSVGTFRSNFSSFMPEPPPSPGGESFVSSSSAASSFISRLHHVHSASGFGDMEASGHADESSYQSFRDVSSARNGAGPGDALSVISAGSAKSRASGFFSGIAGKTSRNKDDKKPKFMTQESGSLNDHQHHRDFEASLL